MKGPFWEDTPIDEFNEIIKKWKNNRLIDELIWMMRRNSVRAVNRQDAIKTEMLKRMGEFKGGK